MAHSVERGGFSKYNVQVTETPKVKLIESGLTKASQDGKLAVPLDHEGNLGFVELPRGQYFLRPGQKLVDILDFNCPTALVPCRVPLLYDLTQEGFDANDKIPIFCVLYHKTDGDEITKLEEMRTETVAKRYSSGHISSFAHPETALYDEDSFRRIGHANNSTSLGMALITRGTDGEFICLGSADIKYGASEEYVYQYESEEPISGKYVRGFIKRCVEAKGVGINLISENEENIEQELVEQEEGTFSIKIKEAKVDVRGLPVDTLLADPKYKKPHLEIGQFAISTSFKGGGIFIVASLTRLLDTALSINSEMVAGLSISPHLLRQVLQIKYRKAQIILKLIEPFLKVTGFESYEDFLHYLAIFTDGMKPYPSEVVKKSKITFRDGSSIILNALIQAETFESPAEFDKQLRV